MSIILRTKPKEVIQPSYLLRPRVDLRINLNKILDLEALNKISPFSPEKYARQIFLRSEEKDLLPGHMVWLRISTQDSQVIYELIDPLAADLKRCQNVFIEVLAYQDHSATLTQFCAPSFPGKKAITVLQNIMALGQLHELEVRDGAVTPACCDTGALSLFRTLGAFIHGKGWYETQGAAAGVSEKVLRSHYLDELLENDEDPRIYHTKDWDRFVFDRSSLCFQEFQPSKETYLAACQFLHSLSIKDLKNSFAELYKVYPSLQSMHDLLHAASIASPSSISIGDLLKNLKDVKNDKIHDLYHEIRDKIVSNKGSVFFQYILDTFNRQKETDEFSCALAFCIIAHFGTWLKNGAILPKEEWRDRSWEYSYHDSPKIKIMQNVFYDLLKANNEQRECIAKKLSPAFDRLGEEAHARFEKTLHAPHAKICSNSTHLQRKKRYDYKEEIGIQDRFFAIQQAIRYVGQLTPHSIATLDPEFAKNIHEYFGTLVTPQTTLKNLMGHNATGRKWVINELLFGAHKHLSTLFIHCLTRKEVHTPEKTYALFMLSKYIIQRFAYLSFKVN